MTENATKSYVDAALLKHENKRIESCGKVKEQVLDKIGADRHDCKNRDHVLGIDISENKESIALHQQSQKFMQEKVDNIEKHLTEGIADIKQIIKEQAATFATKAEHKENQVAIKWIIKIMWGIGTFVIGLGAVFIWNFLITK